MLSPTPTVFVRRPARAACVALAGLALCAAVPPAAMAQGSCTSAWSDQFALAGVTAQISDTIIWDDGTGPALYAVGSFPGRQIGRIYSIIDASLVPPSVSGAFSIARWDGRNWNIVGPAIIFEFDAINTLGRINAIDVFDPDGPGPLRDVLVVGGQGNAALGSLRQFTLAFDGTNWTTLGSFFGDASSDEVRDLETFQGDLYACGRFTGAIAGIARFDRTVGDWVDVAGGIPTTATNARAERMAAGDADGDGTPELYIAGTFTFSATGGTANKLVKWNGSNYATVPGWTNTSTPIQANLGGPSVLRFLDIGDGPALLVGDAIYAGLASPANTRGVALARLKNNVWSTLLPQTGTSAGNTKSYVYAADMFAGPSGSQLHIGGTRLLNGVSGQPTGVSLARRTAGGTFEPLGTFPPTPATNTATVAWMRPVDWDAAGPGGTKLLFGATQYRFGTIGTFGTPGTASELQPQGLALWNGSAVELAHSGSAPLGLAPGMIKELDPDGAGPAPETLYIGHFSSVVAGVPTSGLVAFDGTNYQRTPAGITGVVAAEAFTPAGGTTALYAAGELPNANGAALVRLDGSAWTTIAQPSASDDELQPPGIDAVVTATVAGEPSLVVSGRFRDMGGTPSRFVARYNGTAWIAMDAGLPAPSGNPNELFRAHDFATRVVNLNGELFTTVQHTIFDLTTNLPVIQPSRFYRWNGTAWQDIGPGEGRLAVLDLGAGPRLYSIRNFQPAGSDNSFIAEWNGSGFVQVGPGFNWSNPVATRSNIQAVGVHDFGQGKRLIALLDSPATTSSGPVSGLVALSGGQWTQVPGGEQLSQSTILYSSSNAAWGGLYVGGAIRAVGNNAQNQNGVESQGIARLVTTCPPACPADFNGAGGVTVQDIFDYLSAYFAGDLRADVNASGSLTVQDIFDFLTAYFAGC